MVLKNRFPIKTRLIIYIYIYIYLQIGGISIAERIIHLLGDIED